MLHQLPANHVLPKRRNNSPATFLRPMTLRRYAHGVMQEVSDLVAVEEPLVVKVRGRESFSLVRTPGDDHNLVTGYLFSQGMIRRHSDIRNISFTMCGESPMACVELVPADNIRFMNAGQNTAACIEAERLFDLKDMFEKRQALYHSTRATHAAALFSMDGRMIAFGEDVGRHNAFDKALGKALSSESIHDVGIAMLSSRLALELAEKASTAGIGILCGFSVATSSALEFAETRDITLVGRLRETTMNVYTHPRRIIA